MIDSYFQALDDCGIVVDASVEREMLKKFSVLTSAVHQLTFPPALQGAQVSAVQSAHRREAMRVGNQLQREAANRLRAAKLKNATAPVSVYEAVIPSSNRPLEPSSSPERHPTFISYAWETPEHRQWVLDFATTLRHNGVDVVLDQWHLPPGADMYHFMEQSVRSAVFVLVICTPTYAEKANARLGGVG